MIAFPNIDGPLAPKALIVFVFKYLQIQILLFRVTFHRRDVSAFTGSAMIPTTTKLFDVFTQKRLVKCLRIHGTSPCGRDILTDSVNLDKSILKPSKIELRRTRKRTHEADTRHTQKAHTDI